MEELRLNDAQKSAIEKQGSNILVSAAAGSGKTTVLFTDATKYNDPTGSQLVIRESNGQKLLVYHRFKDSLSLEKFALKYDIKLFEPVSLYGIADKDFSACVWVS